MNPTRWHPTAIPPPTQSHRHHTHEGGCQERGGACVLWLLSLRWRWASPEKRGGPQGEHENTAHGRAGPWLAWREEPSRPRPFSCRLCGVFVVFCVVACVAAGGPVCDAWAVGGVHRRPTHTQACTHAVPPSRDTVVSAGGGWAARSWLMCGLPMCVVWCSAIRLTLSVCVWLGLDWFLFGLFEMKPACLCVSLRAAFIRRNKWMA